MLSLFPGLGVLGKAFEEAGWWVVRGPDVIWGGDVRDFNPPPGHFPRCDRWTSLPVVQRIGSPEQHGLTLPPGTGPVRGFGHGGQTTGAGTRSPGGSCSLGTVGPDPRPLVAVTG